MENTLEPSLLKKYSLEYSVPESTIQDIKKAFDIIDINQNGSIQPYEFQAILDELGLVDEDGISTKMLVNELDLNKNGYVDFDEFLEFSLKKIDEKSEKEEIEKVFSYYDEENKGKIQVKDLEKVAGFLGQKMQSSEIKKMFAALDFNGDGFVEKQDFHDMIVGKFN